ncbi:MAG: hypothetical protein HC898_05950 [Phycisphaerales bacterium]|nr:hypothetical protein [Phycisphaerales bacterium]
MKIMQSRGSCIVLAGLLCLLSATMAIAWPMAWAAGPDGQGGSRFAEEVFGIEGRHSFRENRTVRVQLYECNIPANILWPGDKPTFVFQVENLTDQPMNITGKVDVIQYALRTPGDDFSWSTSSSSRTADPFPSPPKFRPRVLSTSALTICHPRTLWRLWPGGGPRQPGTLDGGTDHPCHQAHPGYQSQALSPGDDGWPLPRCADPHRRGEQPPWGCRCV